MCKQVAAILFGIGARFDSQPELLFMLRQVDPAELLSKASRGVITAPAGGGRALGDDDGGALIGLEMDASFAGAPAAAAAPKKPRVPAKPAGVSPPSARPSRPSTKPARARDTAVRLLAALRQAASLDNAVARAATGLEAEAVRPLLRQLVAGGHARVHGRGRGTRYVAVGKVQKP